MTNSKLVQLLRTFSKDEFKRFDKFVHSPYFYKDKSVTKLFEALREFYPDFNNGRLTKTFLFEKMYPEKKYSDSQMKYLMSEMFSMGKRFLSFRNLEKDPFELNIRLLKELNSRNTPAIFENQLERFKSGFESYQIRNEGYFHQMYRMAETVSDFYSYKDRLSQKIEHNKIIENIINNFLISLLNIYYQLSSNANEFQIKINLNLVNFIEDFINKNEDIVNPVVFIYYCMFMLSYKKDEIYYLKLLELKNKYLHSLDDDGKHRIFEALGNYCIEKYQQGGVAYYRKAFDIINDEIKSGVRFNRKEFSEIFFTNKVEIASKVKEFKWAYEFIDKYMDRLNNQNRIDIVNFSKAIIEYESKNYIVSLDLLSKINLHHPLLRFRIRNYTMLNYYELNYLEAAYSLIDSYRHMLEKDKKIEISRKERYKTFLYYCQKLLGMKSGYKKTEKDILRNNIEKNSVFMKQWLLEKINEL